MIRIIMNSLLGMVIFLVLILGQRFVTGLPWEEETCLPDSPCSVTCGGGVRYEECYSGQIPKIRRKRSVRTRLCNTQCCPVSCLWDSWGSWGSCSTTCGSGTKTRSRTKSVIETCGGTCSGTPIGSASCSINSASNCVWGSWTGWSTCSETSCGITGYKERTRTKTVLEKCGGSCSGVARETTNCYKCCPVSCLWGGWSSWGTCSKTCGSGNRQRTRSKSRTESCGGSSCSGSSTGSQSCNTNCCPVSCLWGSWGSWGSCSKTCGTGNRIKTRSKSRTESCGGSCSGTSTSSQTCNTNCCPVSCLWGSWGSWGTCSKTCGTGNKVRSRSKTRTESCGGSACSGSYTASTPCNTNCCPVSCDWNDWGSWGSCSASCDTGTKSRTRSKSKQSSCGGTCSGSTSDSTSCNAGCCPVDCLWGNWGLWGSCSKTCGSGSRTRQRSKVIDETCRGTCPGQRTNAQTCNTNCCPVDCTWNLWSPWGACEDSCGASIKRRTREENPAVCGGDMCQGEKEETQQCDGNTQHGCPVNCEWSLWSPWNSCSVSCGSGDRKRLRTKHVVEKNGGSCTGKSEESETCEMNLNPTDCVLGTWSSWGDCQGSCDIGGIKVRSRVVIQNATACGKPCDTNQQDTGACVIAGCSGNTSAPNDGEISQKESTHDGASGLSLTTIIGIGVGGFVVTVIVVTMGVVICCIRRKTDSAHRNTDPASAPQAYDGLRLDGDVSEDNAYTELDVKESAVYEEINK